MIVINSAELRNNIKKKYVLSLLIMSMLMGFHTIHGQIPAKSEVIDIITKVNDHWQATHPNHSNAFWHPAAYQTGNMEAYFVTGKAEYRKYAEEWATYNQWKGAKSEDKANWRYTYGENDNFVLFGDWQICFQTYIDLYQLDRRPENEYKIARAKEVMAYQMSTPKNDYWWWADGLYMVMPVMTKLYKVTQDELFLTKLYEYFAFARDLMYDAESGLFFRDAKYVFPAHKTNSGLKDFWSRGNGWVFAGLAKVLQDLPETDSHRSEYIRIYRAMAEALKKAQQPEGYWTRSLLDPAQAPGYETSGTAFFTYGYLWGINNGILDKDSYLPVITKSWRYLVETALQPNGSVGYVQPIGERADQHSNVGAGTTSDFGVGAFLLAASEMSRLAKQDHPLKPVEKDYTGYLFAYFTGNRVAQEAIHFAVSMDGYNYFALNDGQPVLDSKDISSTGGVRDPHILRREDGKGFYMVATDMTSSKGWDSNRAMTLLKSDDLINWTSSVVNIQQKYEGQEELKRVWAPQTIYDKEAGKYMIYWSMKHGNGTDIIYYSYANKDFTDLETVPKQLFFPQNGRSCIDGDIVFKDSLYYMFYKTEGHGNGIKLATTRSLTSGQWDEKEGYKQLTAEAVEGSSVFRLSNSNTYILMYDVYMKGEFHFTKSEDLEIFSPFENEISMNFKPRHGSIIPVTRSELKRITDKWGKPKGLGELPYNPVLPGFHADPQILYARQTQKYYIYSTTDGVPGWGGWYFTVYSSDDLKEWKYEEVVLDLKSDQVSWANGNAWAPTIVEKQVNGKYKYFLYFSGNAVNGRAKQIGVATADSPVGPFTDSGSPIITESPAGRGQQIDPAVFIDPVSGKTYLYWGNGYMAGAELNDDMVSLKKESITVMTPEGGTLQDYAFREGAYVFFRNGLYYFMWSVDDTGSPNYHVAYGTSRSPLGPIEVAKEPVVLIQNPTKEIYGPAHHSVIQKPETDEWYIVYHRINKHFLERSKGPGYHREVCIDRMEFNADGTIKRITPTN